MRHLLDLDLSTKPAIVVHGGAWTRPGADPGPYERGCALAAEAGFAVLVAGGSALDAAIAAVRVMEDDPVFNAGVGSCLTAAGTVEMDASVMCGDLSAGGVAGVAGVRNPIDLARAVMERTGHVLLSGHGAEAFAREVGLPMVDPSFHVTAAQRKRFEELQAEQARAGRVATDKLGTVGAVAIDLSGRVAAATSTGGTAFKRAGRIGDSPIIGAGTYADDLAGAVSATGHGESILKLSLSKEVADRMRAGASAMEACAAAARLCRERVNGDAGLIAIDRTGRGGWAFNTPSMSRAFLRPGLSAPLARVLPD